MKFGDFLSINTLQLQHIFILRYLLGFFLTNFWSFRRHQRREPRFFDTSSVCKPREVMYIRPRS